VCYGAGHPTVIPMENITISTLLGQKDATLLSVPPGVSISEAVHEMNRHKVGSLLVLEGGQLTGIFTERDVLTRVVECDLDPKQHTVAEVMTRNPITITRETTVEQALGIFTNRRCRHLPVMENGQVIGLISIGDVSRWISEAYRHEAQQLKQYISGGYPT
jgi:CBS domain-containing protein